MEIGNVLKARARDIMNFRQKKAAPRVFHKDMALLSAVGLALTEHERIYLYSNS